MKRYALLIVAIFLIAPMLPFANETVILSEAPLYEDTSAKSQQIISNVNSPLISSFRIQQSLGFMDAKITNQDQIILTWTVGKNFQTGYINSSIRIMSFPTEGAPSQSSLGYEDLVLERLIPLPTNMSDFRNCRSNVLSDQSVMLVCRTNDADNVMRIDISNQSLEIPRYYGGVFVWNSTGDIQSMWTYERSTSNCRGYVNDATFGDTTNKGFVFENDSFLTSLGCLDQNPTYFGNTSLSCPGNDIGCSAIVKFDRNGTVENVVYMEHTYQGTWGDGAMACSLSRFDVNPFGFIEFMTASSVCRIKDLNGTLLHTTGGGYEWIVLDSQFNFIRNQIYYPQYSSDMRFVDIETSQDYTYYTIAMGDENLGFTSSEYQLLGSNLSRFDPGTGNHEHLYSLISVYNTNQTTKWAYTWEVEGHPVSEVPPNIRGTQDGVFWVGPDGTPILNWGNEVNYRTPPYPGPSNTANSYSVSIDTNGTWVDNTNLNYGNTVNCDSDGVNNLEVHNYGVSCMKTYWRTERSESYFEILMHDNDFDGVGQLVDAFPNDATQWHDSDLDGYGDNQNGIFPDDCIDEAGNSTIDRRGCLDTDGDGQSNLNDIYPSDKTQFLDSDYDGYGDNETGIRGDSCPTLYGESTRNSTLGCPDSDYDGWADSQDMFKGDSSQWNDSDLDGYGDELNGNQGDACPNTIGTSTKDRYGCIDTDEDGWSDDGDDLPQNPTQWLDRDGDGYGDNQDENATMSDAFPADGTQWNDTDEDGHGDNPFGTQGDWFPNDPTRWQDSDQDGVADEDDAFPNEITQWNDTDGDGYGDEENGNSGDAFPNDDTEWFDSDMDGLGDNADAFPFDPTQKVDADGDGMGDNPMGIGADKFPEDATQWGDIDGDGYGDNPNGTSPDAFITDATQWSDEDGDGYGDNPAGRLYDQFPLNPTQWLDEDGDGLGDNLNGTNADPSLNDFDNDGYNDSIDPLPKLPSPGDLDNDGVVDVNDQFPDDAREWADYDGDGEGDNADTDDDNDGWADTDEVRLGTDPFGAADVPIDSFEIVIPGTAVGLGAWDLIGMFGGIPLFMWIGFGFVTRNGRTAKYEGLLREAQSRDELEDVARMWEYSLMLRMLGPHQGIRLERLRAELDDRFEAQNQSLSSIEPQQHDQTQMVEQAMQVEQKSLPSIESTQPEITAQGNPDGKGYEWYTDAQETSWYRNEDSNSEWQRFEA